MELGEIKKYYIWERTSQRGKTEIYLAETEDAVYFESGRSVSKADWESGILRQIEESEYLRITPKDNENLFQLMSNPLLNDPSLQPQQSAPINPIIEQPKEINPIRLILEKQKKKETISIPIEINVDIPSKKVMSLLDMMFDREEVTQEIIKTVTSTINVDSIVNNIELQIRSSIENAYEEDEKKE